MENELAKSSAASSKSSDSDDQPLASPSATEHQNALLKEQVSKLIAQMAEMANRNNQLEVDLQSLSNKLVREVERRGSLENQLDGAKNEMEELSQSLFEEANGMVFTGK
jgi:predicted nuclease with TOPRIM domain